MQPGCSLVAAYGIGQGKQSYSPGHAGFTLQDGHGAIGTHAFRAAARVQSVAASRVQRVAAKLHKVAASR